MNRHFQVVRGEDCYGETQSAELTHRRSGSLHKEKKKPSAFQIDIDVENGSFHPSVYSLCLSDASIQQNTVTVNTFTLLLVQRSLENVHDMKEDGQHEGTKIGLTSTKIKKQKKTDYFGTANGF